MNTEKSYVVPKLDVMSIAGRETGRDLREYASILGFANADALLNWIKDKNVLDIGSGLGMFAFDVMRRKNSEFANIISLNPGAADECFVQKQKDIMMCLLRDHKPSSLLDDKVYDRQGALKLLELLKMRTVAALWGAKYVEKTNGRDGLTKEKEVWAGLPFGDESFDRIVSVYSLPFYFGSKKLHNEDSLSKGVVEEILEKETEEEIIHVLKDIYRILKSGGECRFGPGSINPIFNKLIENDTAKSFGFEVENDKKHNVIILKKPLKELK